MNKGVAEEGANIQIWLEKKGQPRMEHMKGRYSEGVEKVKTKNYKGKKSAWGNIWKKLKVTFEWNWSEINRPLMTCVLWLCLGSNHKKRGVIGITEITLRSISFRFW